MRKIFRKIGREYPITAIALAGSATFAGLACLAFNGGCEDYKKADVTLDNGDHAEVREYRGGTTEVVLGCYTKIIEVSDGSYSIMKTGICSEYHSGIGREQARRIYEEATKKAEESRK